MFCIVMVLLMTYSAGRSPADTQRNNVIITSKRRRFDVIIVSCVR